MRISPKLLLAAAGVAAVGVGAAHAATEELETMQVALPDGGAVEVRYTGDVAPRVVLRPAAARDAAPAALRVPAAFAEMQRISALMDMRMDAMMRQAAMMQQAALEQQQALASGQPGMVLAGDIPAGAHLSYVSSTTDASGCTRTVSWSSDGAKDAQGQPMLQQASSGSCEAAPRSPVVKASAEAPARAPAPGTKT
ncbi:hypothetical protein B2G71_00855 [Novosphingobium sp. PC22D]|uniref:hypothetical protein n=1 Tax=Novosphingobium sp. PC22D TaxID=1962403 RepID=UPI000BF24911|nr:hypothetical protein [Novosphingobium sp. PC22D]PEQ14192.1 hypothetical protein B2G71_00855 [Novosphingobium sp. PC22D]